MEVIEIPNWLADIEKMAIQIYTALSDDILKCEYEPSTCTYSVYVRDKNKLEHDLEELLQIVNNPIKLITFYYKLC